MSEFLEHTKSRYRRAKREWAVLGMIGGTIQVFFVYVYLIEKSASLFWFFIGLNIVMWIPFLMAMHTLIQWKGFINLLEQSEKVRENV